MAAGTTRTGREVATELEQEMDGSPLDPPPFSRPTAALERALPSPS